MYHVFLNASAGLDPRCPGGGIDRCTMYEAWTFYAGDFNAGNLLVRGTFAPNL